MDSNHQLLIVPDPLSDYHPAGLSHYHRLTHRYGDSDSPDPAAKHIEIFHKGSNIFLMCNTS